MPCPPQEPRLRAAEVMAGHWQREDDPQPLRLSQGLPAEEGICEVCGLLDLGSSATTSSQLKH